jgi:hypothetical protein
MEDGRLGKDREPIRRRPWGLSRQRPCLHPAQQLKQVLPVFQGLHDAEVQDGLHVFDLFTQTW